MPCKSLSMLTNLLTSTNILEPGVRQAFSLILTFSSRRKLPCLSSRKTIKAVMILVMLAGASLRSGFLEASTLPLW